MVLASIIALSICGLQMIQLLKPIPAGNSPYTRWLSIDPFSFFTDHLFYFVAFDR